MKKSVWLGISVVLFLAWLLLMSQPLYGIQTGFLLLFLTYAESGTWQANEDLLVTQIGIRGLSFVMLAAVVATAIAGIRKRD